MKSQSLNGQIGVLPDNDKTDVDRTTLYYRQYLRQTIIVQDIDLADIDKTTLPIQTFMYRLVFYRTMIRQTLIGQLCITGNI